MGKVKLEGQESPEQIEKWKEEHENVFTIKFDDCISYVRKPSRVELSYLMTLQADPIKLAEQFFKKCKIGGSDKIFSDISYMLGASSVIEHIITVKKAELGKL